MGIRINIITGESPPHKHKDYEIIVCTKGTGIFKYDEKGIKMVPGKIVVIPPGVMHSGLYDDVYERIYISGEFNQIFSITSPCVITDNARKEGIQLAKIIYDNRHANNEYLSALVNAFVYFLLQNMKIDDDMFLVIKDIVEAISNDYYNSNIDLSSILRQSGYAEDYIRSQFTKIVGKTPTHFLTETRIHHACYLIDIYGRSLSLADIGEKCGYTDYTYFSKRFKRIMGVSPREYRDGN